MRAYTIADEAELFDVFSDPYARRFYPQTVDRAKVRAWVEWNLCNYGEFGFGLWFAVTIPTASLRLPRAIKLVRLTSIRS